MTRESAVQYFSKKTGFIIWLVGLVGLCMIYVGYTGERRSVIFMIIGVVLIALTIYEVIRAKRHMKNGSQLDTMAEDELKKLNIFGMALTKLCLSKDDTEGLEMLTFRGYCAFPIQTQPYFRRDETDKKLRTSNYQTSLFIFREDRFYAYSYCISLVDKEKNESGRMWRYGEIKEARLVREELTYLIGTNDEKRETSQIEYLSITDTGGSRFSFFFNQSDNGQAAVEHVLALIEAGKGAAPEISAEQKAAQEELEFVAEAKRSAPSAARGRDLDVGIIGSDLKDYVK